MKNSFVASLDRELTVLDQEMALLEKELQHVRRRQDKVRKLKGLYTGVNVLRDELGEAEVQITIAQEEMIAPGERKCRPGTEPGRDRGTRASGFWIQGWQSTCFARPRPRSRAMKRVALYLRVSTTEQCPESQLQDLRVLAEQRDFLIVEEYTDHGISGARASRPALDRLLQDARRGKFDVIAIWAFDRLARSVSHLLQLLDELHELGIEFVSYREAFDTHGALGPAITVILGAIAELERSIIRERVCAGIRRARREGRHLGRRPLPLDYVAIARDRQRGMSIRQVAAIHRTSKSTVQRIVTSCPKNPVFST